MSLLTQLKVKGKFDKNDKTFTRVPGHNNRESENKKTHDDDDIETMLDNSLEDHPEMGQTTGSSIREYLLGTPSKSSGLSFPDYIPESESQRFDDEVFDHTGYDFIISPPRNYAGPSLGFDNDDDVIFVDDEDTLKLGDPVPPTPPKRLFQRHGASFFPSGTTQDSLRRMNAREFDFNDWTTRSNKICNL